MLQAMFQRHLAQIRGTAVYSGVPQFQSHTRHWVWGAWTSCLSALACRLGRPWQRAAGSQVEAMAIQARRWGPACNMVHCQATWQLQDLQVTMPVTQSANHASCSITHSVACLVSYPFTHTWLPAMSGQQLVPISSCLLPEVYLG